MNLKKRVIVVVIFSILLIAGALFFSYNFKEEGFSVKTFLLKSNIPVGGESVYKIDVVNNEDFSKVFEVSFENIDEVADTEDKSFILGPNEKKEISIILKDSNLEVTVYSGKLIISDGSTIKEIPLILTVEDDRNLLSIIHSMVPAYSDVYPGGKLGVDIKVYNLDGFTAPTLKAESFIRMVGGGILWANEQDLIVDGSKTEIVDIPKDWEAGDYVFVTIIDYKGVKSISTYFFTVSTKEYNLLTNFNSKLLILLGVIFVLGFVILLFYFMKSRDEFLIMLKKQQAEELKKNVKLIDYSRKKIQLSKHVSLKKKDKIKKLKKLKKKIIHKIKKKQAVQRKELKKLRKKKDKKGIKKKLNSWKSQGYKMFEAEEEFNQHSDLKTQIKNWRNQGYKID